MRLRQKEKQQAVICTPSCECTLSAGQRGSLALADGFSREPYDTCKQKREKKMYQKLMRSQKLTSHGSGSLPNFEFARSQIRLCHTFLSHN